MNPQLPENFMITDSGQIDAVSAAEKLPPKSGIILRDYKLSYSARLKLGLRLKKICQQKKIPLLVAKDFKLALALNTNGMHFPEFMMAEARRIKAKKPDWLVMIAAHSKAKSLAAYNSNLDAVLISPVYKTSSHPNKKPIGLSRAGLLIYRDMLAYALGGVGLKHKKLLKNKGFQGLAGISWVKECV